MRYPPPFKNPKTATDEYSSTRPYICKSEFIQVLLGEMLIINYKEWSAYHQSTLIVIRNQVDSNLTKCNDGNQRVTIISNSKNLIKIVMFKSRFTSHIFIWIGYLEQIVVFIWPLPVKLRIRVSFPHNFIFISPFPCINFGGVWFGHKLLDNNLWLNFE